MKRERISNLQDIVYLDLTCQSKTPQNSPITLRERVPTHQSVGVTMSGRL